MVGKHVEGASRFGHRTGRPMGGIGGKGEEEGVVAEGGEELEGRI